MNQKARDEHLAQFFPADTLSQLDEALKNVLYDDFANSELRILGTQDVETITARAARNVSAEYERRLTFIQPEEYPILKDWYLENSKSLHEIICSKCGALLGIEVDTLDANENKHHHEGKFVVAIGSALWAYRPRLDGVMGYQCGNELNPEAIQNYNKEMAEVYKKREARQPEVEKEVIARINKRLDETHDKQVQEIVDSPLFPKATSKAKAEKVIKDFAPAIDETVQTEVLQILQSEFPEPETPKLERCDNDTRWAEIEIANVPEDHVMTSVTKEDIVKVKQEMNVTNYEPDVKKTKRGYKVESFELREVKA